MDEPKGTPEEKLLRLIENPNVERPKEIPSLAKTSTSKEKKTPFLLKAFDIIKISARYLNLQTVNKALITLSAFLTVFFIFNHVKERGVLDKRFQRLEAEAAASAVAEPEADLPHIIAQDVMAQVRDHNIFSIMSLPAPEEAPKEEEAETVTKELLSTLKLVGILWSESPQAMIEDTSGQRTYLVNAGDSVGVFKVKDISKEKVILEKDGKEWELR